MFKNLAQIGKPDDFEKAYNYAVYLLGLHSRTEGEIGEKLAAKKYDAQNVRNVIDCLRDRHFLDDQSYARIFLDNLKRYKHFGFYGIKKKLVEKRLPSAIVESVLRDGLSIPEELKIAKRFLQKHLAVAGSTATKQPSVLTERLPRHDRLSLAIKNKQKLAQRLASRGFRSEVISKLLF